tara:strand:- start:399 stop:737 length:339 start_codon:yes stop_codon:yes gene_type:complete
MTKENNTESAVEWAERFGVVKDVTERESKKGPYVTFMVDCGEFQQIGAAFNEDAAAFMKASVGRRVWLKGPMNPRQITKDGETKTVKSFNVIRFKDITKDEAVAAEQEAAAA